jgi:short-subunit dehydrogenase
VNNAGVLEPGPLARVRPTAIVRMLAVNLAALVLLTHVLLPGMLRRRAGAVGQRKRKRRAPLSPVRRTISRAP